MFLVSFAWYTWVFTSFLRLKRGLVFLICTVVLGALILFGTILVRKGNRSMFLAYFKKFFIAQGIGFFLAWGSVGAFLMLKSPNLVPDFFSFSSLKIEVPKSVFSPFMQEVLVLEQTKPTTYLVQTLSGEQYFLKTEKTHHVWTALRLGASLKARDPSKLYTELALGSGWQAFFDYQFNYDKWMLMKSIDGTLYEKFSLPSKDSAFHDTWLHATISSAREWLKNRIQQLLPNQEWALLLGMLIGDKSQLETQAYQDFVSSGIVHIIAVSGGNLVMIVVFLSTILFLVPFYVRNGMIILGVVAFALLCWGDSSVVRALIMAVLSLLALFRGREIQVWRLLQYAFVLMLCYNPFFLSYDLWFLLSFGAVIGIVLVSERWSKLQEIQTLKALSSKKKVRLPFLWAFLKNYGLPTLGATLWTLPILLFFIGETNLTGVMINLIVVPLVPIITIGGFVLVLLGVFTGWSWIILPIKWLLSLVFWLSDLAIQWKCTIVITTIWAKWLFVLLTLLIGIIVYALIRKKDEFVSIRSK